jgi:RNA polymerase sigma-70 factor (ECF subfamily)
MTPDRVFEHRWALALFQNALARLREECATAGKGDIFSALKEFLSEQPAGGEYAAAAAKLGLSAGAVSVAVHRLRQRYSEIVREEIAHTVSDPAEVPEEMRYLIGLVGK